jgi:alkylhydroperoxidase family enzyme
MFVLQYQTPEQATGSVAEVYAHFRGRTTVPAPLQLLSASPDLLRLQFEQIRHYMGHQALSFPLLCAIRFLASQQVCFEHCQTLNRSWLLKSGLAAQDLDKLLQGQDVEAFSDRENALLRVVAKVLAKERVLEADVQALRDLGFTDSDILDACAQGTTMIGVSYLFEAFSE